MCSALKIQQDESYSCVCEAVYRSRVSRKRRYHRADNAELLVKDPAGCYEIRAVVVASYWKTAQPSLTQYNVQTDDAVHIINDSTSMHNRLCVGANVTTLCGVFSVLSIQYNTMPNDIFSSKDIGDTIYFFGYVLFQIWIGLDRSGFVRRDRSSPVKKNAPIVLRFSSYWTWPSRIFTARQHSLLC